MREFAISRFSCSPRSSISHSSELVGPVATVCAGGGDPTLRLIEKKVEREWANDERRFSSHATWRPRKQRSVCEKKDQTFLYVSFSDIISSFSCDFFSFASLWMKKHQIDLRYCACSSADEVESAKEWKVTTTKSPLRIRDRSRLPHQSNNRISRAKRVFFCVNDN